MTAGNGCAPTSSRAFRAQWRRSDRTPFESKRYEDYVGDELNRDRPLAAIVILALIALFIGFVVLMVAGRARRVVGAK